MHGNKGVWGLSLAAIATALSALGSQPARAEVLLPGAGQDSAPQSAAQAGKEKALTQDWMARWGPHILEDAHNRYCDKETGEEVGWLISPFLNGFYYGYQATHDPQWVDRFVDWADAWIGRGVKEPDGYIGWPKVDTTGAKGVENLMTDSLLGEAMGLRPVVLMAHTILMNPALKQKYGEKARSYLHLAEQTFQKWDQRGAWRDVGSGGLWVVVPFGIDPQTGQWTEGYARRHTDGFSLPDNKENFIALWLLSLYDVTKKPIYRERAEKWFRIMQSRMKLRDGGKYYVWDYWDPAGPWDYNPDGSTRHWVGVHPNGGYYDVDVEGIVAAYEHHLVFTRKEIDRLIATNRDFMWNHKVQGAAFQRIDGGQPDDRWKNLPGALWTALVPYDATLRKVFEANHDPASWGGLAATPWYVARESGKLPAGG
jgi:hypothetical protein